MTPPPPSQYGGLRPFGCAFIFAGYDSARGFQLYQSDPSGNYSGWKATAIGTNAATAISTLKTEYKEGLTLEEGKLLAIKVRAACARARQGGVRAAAARSDPPPPPRLLARRESSRLRLAGALQGS